MTGPRNLEWKLRLKLTDGSVRVGGYVGSQEGSVYLADELSGEVLEYSHQDVEDFDVRKY